MCYSLGPEEASLAHQQVTCSQISLSNCVINPRKSSEPPASPNTLQITESQATAELHPGNSTFKQGQNYGKLVLSCLQFLKQQFLLHIFLTHIQVETCIFSIYQLPPAWTDIASWGLTTAMLPLVGEPCEPPAAAVLSP